MPDTHSTLLSALALVLAFVGCTQTETTITDTPDATTSEVTADSTPSDTLSADTSTPPDDTLNPPDTSPLGSDTPTLNLSMTECLAAGHGLTRIATINNGAAHGEVFAATLSPRNTIALFSSDGQLKTWNILLATPSPNTLEKPQIDGYGRVLDSRITHLAYLTASGIVVARSDGTVSFVDDFSGSDLAQPLSLSGPITALTTFSGGDVAVAAGPEVRVWTPETGAVQTLSLVGSAVTHVHHVSFLEPEQLLVAGAAADNSGVAEVWDLSTSQIMDSFSSPEPILDSAGVGTKIVYVGGGFHHTIDSLEPGETLVGSESGYEQISDSTGSFYVTTHTGPRFMVWDGLTHEPLETVDTLTSALPGIDPLEILHVSIPNPRTIITIENDGDMSFWGCAP